ncbi:tripartite tricarboxylate transport protein TctABC, membrane-spanning subunit TctB [Malaciobacter molluscorum LMG 25693]|uniref:Tripartite tricarboxylate transport protein TctABC, membrane-spanning subunit TctB n=1 Tax=Malaciobacter molluscorum LMG 25693 TaxID=870501 RepID=A0AB33GVX1_9BACT|nr:tripartite tricarboxylate transporter TctB family protein [Malaciobacter molluscorum]AXX93643.1 tripartite tricarboxylate transport protein TctABC, membrane-spanning subunit TctB [Malaciobacter molluscorum LMG 25693]
MIADRIFAGISLLLIIGYGYIAFYVIKAPFQYDPLGPESWPKILAVVSGLSALYLILKPDNISLDISKSVFIRLITVTILLFGYSFAYEPLGFIIATFLFCGLFARLLGANTLNSIYFGLGLGIFGYVLCAIILELNLPAGPLESLLG